MSRAEQVILTNMCMVTDGKGNVLMQDRTDPHWSGSVFPGGHVEPGESFVQSGIREVREETGLTVRNPRLCGVKQFWTEEGARYVVLLFCANEYEGELRSSDEGEAMWVPRSELSVRRCVPKFDHLLKIFEDDRISELFYDGKACFF